MSATLLGAGNKKVSIAWFFCFEGFFFSPTFVLVDETEAEDCHKPESHNNRQRYSRKTEIFILKLQNYFSIILLLLLQVILETRYLTTTPVNLQRKNSYHSSGNDWLFNLLKQNSHTM